ncbi:unnamed protein product [Sphenostylis stenocarpa]|uniref:Uncharacterized protein n=1 Tax=Sphenostylis stenocarpa TaxID=92480 RepID=A0AA86VUI7_9FABA|nr:unnamed protein product [Sphenostylis stenocarpa]
MSTRLWKGAKNQPDICQLIFKVLNKYSWNWLRVVNYNLRLGISTSVALFHGNEGYLSGIVMPSIYVVWDIETVTWRKLLY